MNVTRPSPARGDLDQALLELATGAEAWTRLPVSDRARTLRRVRSTVAAAAEEWTAAAARAKHIPTGSPVVGEEWMSGPYAALEAVAAYQRSLVALSQGRSPVDRLRVHPAPGARTAVRILPSGALRSVLFHGFSADIWTAPGDAPDQVRRQAGLDAATVGTGGGVCLVLGAGNITSIAPLDALYELVARGRASLVKLNPTFAGLQEVYERAFAPLVDLGVLRFVTGDSDIGSYLTGHDGVDKVHVTGSRATHDAIVWGHGAEAARRRAEHEPRLDVEITSELGGVSPIIVVDGTWTDADLRFQAEHVATMRLHNAGHNCIAGQMLLLPADWPQRDAFLDALRHALATLPAREPWYPGTAERVSDALRAYPDATVLGGRVLVESRGADAAADPARDTEYFAPVLAWREVPGTGAEFLRSAIDFANDHLDGTLGANIIVDPASRKAMGPTFDDAVADLRYGNIAVNAWTAVGFLLPGATWGAFPGNTLDEVGSGIGVVHNHHLLAHPERTVVTGPFRPFPRSLRGGEFSLFPKPPWFIGARTSATTGRRLTHFAASPSWSRLVGVLLSAFRA